MGLVSIIMPCFNAQNYIEKAIESVIAQSYKKWELLIVDDCSTDNSVSLIKKYKNNEPRIKFIQLNKNSGPAMARNIAIDSAKGRYIAFLDSDDVWLPSKLRRQVVFMNENKLFLTYSSYLLIDGHGNEVGYYNAPKRLNYSMLLKSNFIGNLTGIYDVQRFGKVLLSDMGHEDYILWLSLMRKIGFTFGLNEYLAKYRISVRGISRNKFKTASWQWGIYRNVENLGFMKTLYFFAWYVYYGFTKYKRK